MNKYEALYILRADLSEEAIETQTAKYAKAVTDYKGEVEKIDKWGVRKLAYPIEFKTEGYYVLMNFSAPGELPVELERQMKIADEVIRYIVIKKDKASLEREAAKAAADKAQAAKPVRKKAEKPVTEEKAEETAEVAEPAAEVIAAEEVKAEEVKIEAKPVKEKPAVEEKPVEEVKPAAELKFVDKPLDAKGDLEPTVAEEKTEE